MPYLFDVIYLAIMLFLSPWLLFKAITTGKYRRGLLAKLFGNSWRREGVKPCVWFHAVSVGEVHMLRPLVTRYRERHPDWECLISCTTDTGFDEAVKRFPDLVVCFWPFDFSWAVRRSLHRVRPNLVILAEGELWPNFLRAARALGVPVLVVNGRMSPRSFSRWIRVVGSARENVNVFLRPLLAVLRPGIKEVLRGVDLWGVQTEEYAECFRKLGVEASRVRVTGSVKYDGVEGDRSNPRTSELRRLFSIAPGDLLWIAGSTQDPEEKMVVDIYQRLKERVPKLRLIVVPRQKDRFDAVATHLAELQQSYVRRSQLTKPVEDRSAIVLVDSIGELSAIWGLADVAFVGGSLDGRRGGQNMIEPAAYGAAVIFGTHVWNFRETAARLLAAEAALQVDDEGGLEKAVVRLLANAAERQHLGTAARLLVAQQQGASERTIDLIDEMLSSRTGVFAGANEHRAA